MSSSLHQCEWETILLFYFSSILLPNNMFYNLMESLYKINVQCEWSIYWLWYSWAITNANTMPTMPLSWKVCLMYPNTTFFNTSWIWLECSKKQSPGYCSLWILWYIKSSSQSLSFMLGSDKLCCLGKLNSCLNSIIAEYILNHLK